MKKPIVICSLYYEKNSIKAANRIFDQIGSRLYKFNPDQLSIIVPKGQCPGWIDPSVCIEIPYNQNWLSRIKAYQWLNTILASLPSSLVINTFLPIPFAGLTKHNHIQLIYHLDKKFYFSRNLLLSFQINRLKQLTQFYILTISNASKKQIVDTYNIESDRILVSYCGISDVIFKESLPHTEHQGKDYDLLYIATFSPRKNHLKLIEALPLIGKPVQLALLGVDQGYKYKIKKRIEELNLKNNVDFLEPMSEIDLATLYRRSQVFVSPSLVEGFGMPVAEALACGLPVVCSNIPVFKEVAGEWANYFHPGNPTNIAHELKKALNVTTTLQERNARRTYAWEKFSWDRIVAKLIQDLQEI